MSDTNISPSIPEIVRAFVESRAWAEFIGAFLREDERLARCDSVSEWNRGCSHCKQGTAF